MTDERDSKLHPIQPLGLDEMGTIRFKSNKIVTILLKEGPFDMNQIAMWASEGRVSKDDQRQFAQLIGYSLTGFGDLSYMDDETYETAELMANDVKESDARLSYLHNLVESLKTALREPMARLFEKHPDDLLKE